ncbi:MAG: hypothetical protein BWY21_00520 [Parcubacteria group bacterium ADurb.Bin216]|nr:MAG: hypothetical protein BWY21_00520 [Parcubacteria group bacterium ADurb.Bin216]
MIRVTVELVPFGEESQKKVIGTMKIINDATGSREMGNYKYSIQNEAGDTVESGVYKGFPRALRIWRLIQEIFRIIPKEKI